MIETSSQALEIEIFQRAQAAAREAARAMIAAHPGQCYPCGFSSVAVKVTRKSEKHVRRFVKVLRDAGLCSHDRTNGTYLFYNPGQAATQWLPAKLAGSEAFADVLSEYGIRAKVTERLD